MVDRNEKISIEVVKENKKTKIKRKMKKQTKNKKDERQ